MERNPMKQKLTCGFIGLGLIGGSIAKALRKIYPDCFLMAYDINNETLSLAREEGIINLALSEINESLRDCRYLFLCAPVAINNENLLKVKEFLSPDCLLTDVGSVKTTIHKQIEAAGLSKSFIGGHPMAGSERTGYLNSKAILLENAYYILTPSADVPPEKVTAFKNLASSLLAIPIVLSCELHDYVTAAISHLPHVIAASLVNLVRESDSEDGVMKLIAAGGFKDITRIASSSPVMWQQICLTNGENITSLLDAYIQGLTSVREKLVAKEAGSLYDFFEQARDYRDSFIDAPSGPIKKSYTIGIEIADEPGALASIATLLALNGISIKNIGITHNREQKDGALSIEFYEPESIEAARRILEARSYTVF